MKDVSSVPKKKLTFVFVQKGKLNLTVSVLSPLCALVSATCMSCCTTYVHVHECLACSELLLCVHAVRLALLVIHSTPVFSYSFQVVITVRRERCAVF